ncbi:hypothetical protein KW830_02050 [Comamonas sp. CMM03]|jgi:hypothetical protein|uniref:hypothetical protein n=1 Tax=Comamonas sp. CMM03 TaxID=2854781 RepID=UPI001C494ADC|nr:hypothetical protein [Comamonas sp. CMM03]MBV7417233.1 hypothetical protein [Comamonas sp. CMM03]
MQETDWLEPWTSTTGARDSYLRTFAEQLARETSPGHALHGVPVQLIGRGNGDDALFALLDGTGRVALVHLVWQGQQTPPWPATAIFASLEAWRTEHMVPESREWLE